MKKGKRRRRRRSKNQDDEGKFFFLYFAKVERESEQQKTFSLFLMGCLSQIKQQKPKKKKGMTDFIKITAQYNFNRTKKSTVHVQITRNKK